MNGQSTRRAGRRFWQVFSVALTLTGASVAWAQEVQGEFIGAAATAIGATPTTNADAARLAHQAAFGATEPLIAAIAAAGPKKWVYDQMSVAASRYTSGGTDAVDKWTNKNISYCQQFAKGSAASNTCWRDAYSSIPLLWDFYRQAVTGNDQLRQRVAFALSQIFVVSDAKVDGTYGLRAYHQMLRDNAFSNYRELLRQVTLSPVMGEYLDMVNNEGASPNENYARELLQLFSVGPCALNLDGSLATGECVATYDNADVRDYAYALSGWTYPKGGASPWCTSTCGWRNPRYLSGLMVAVAARHDAKERQLLSGVVVPAVRTPTAALDKVLDSLMKHPNTAPFVATRLIHFMVSSNPSPAYVSRVATAFKTGKYNVFGKGIAGDMQATIAAVLLDTEARSPSVPDQAGLLREPALLFASVVRAFDGQTDGDAFGWWWGDSLNQRVFAPPSVFNFYTQDYVIPGTTLLGPQYQIEDLRATINRLNFANAVANWNIKTGIVFSPNASVPNATGTKVSFKRWETIATDSGKVVDRLDVLLTGGRLSATERQAIIDAMNEWKSQDDSWLTKYGSNYKLQRVRTAAHLLMASPHFAVIR